ncbi:unnamed protein product [Cyclocybe aegerita]|uniref:Uncharacterized protein n=1 Tax=Cyclocybe aegerita TaxID=1973307 RepID=A0A8S0W5S6_CYCAE|nr:unnamed protein product [Cyclocybe aegerita]
MKRKMDDLSPLRLLISDSCSSQKGTPQLLDVDDSREDASDTGEITLTTREAKDTLDESQQSIARDLPVGSSTVSNRDIQTGPSWPFPDTASDSSSWISSRSPSPFPSAAIGYGARQIFDCNDPSSHVWHRADLHPLDARTYRAAMVYHQMYQEYIDHFKAEYRAIQERIVNVEKVRVEQRARSEEEKKREAEEKG